MLIMHMTNKSQNLSILISQLRGAADALDSYAKSESLVEPKLFVIEHSKKVAIARLCNWMDGSLIKFSVIDRKNGLVFGDKEKCDAYNHASPYDEIPTVDGIYGYNSIMRDIRMVVVVDK